MIGVAAMYLWSGNSFVGRLAQVVTGVKSRATVTPPETEGKSLIAPVYRITWRGRDGSER